MKLLNDPHADVLSDVLRGLDVRSTVFCRSLLSRPWGLFVEARPARPAFHLVLSGQAWLEVEGGEGIQLAAGDLVLLPRGNAHALHDPHGSPATHLDDLVSGWSGDGLLRRGGEGPATELLCGGFALAGGDVSPLLAALPPVVRVEGRRGSPVPWLEATLGLLEQEFAVFAPGADAVVTSLADVLLTQALRMFLLSEEGAAVPPLGALRDREIAVALTLVHERPAHPWTVGELAARVAMSRSAFSARFREVVGEPPMRYLTRYRLARAAEYLQADDRSIFEIARLCGYDSAVSLTKAFRRQFGTSPGRYRREWSP
jgi:AraC-like DNA-binding protein